MTETAVITLLYVASAALPFTGLSLAFGQAWYYAAKNEKRKRESAARSGQLVIDETAFTTGDLTAMIQTAAVAPRLRWRALLRDLILVGLGLGCGAWASIWSLQLPT